MSDSQEYKPHGVGSHPTLAGNVLDPNIGADGHMSHGQGVGGTSEQHVREEGLEHIKNNTDNYPITSGDESSRGLASNQPPASNPSAEDASGGLSQGSGSNTILGSVSNYLGFGGSSATTGSQEQVEPRNAEDVAAAPDASSTGAAGGMLAGGRDDTSATDPYATGTSSTGTAGGPAAGIAAYATGSESARDMAEQPDMSATSATGYADPADSRDTTAGDSMARDTTGGTMTADPTTGGAGNIDSAADEGGNTDAVVGDRNVGGEGAADTDKQPSHSDKAAANRTNESSIPTAGGEQLGKKHWGESKIVPDNPKPQQQEAGVSSKAGQPTDEVRDNTSKNTGSHGGSSDDVEKESMVDKLKDKLHMGHK